MTVWPFCMACGAVGALYGILTSDLPATAAGVSWAVSWAIVGASTVNARQMQDLLAGATGTPDTPRPAAPTWAIDALARPQAGAMQSFAATIPTRSSTTPTRSTHRGTARTTAYGRARLTATGTAPAGPVMVEQEWKQPRAAQTTAGDVAVPLLQAAITAAALALFAAFVAWRMGGDVLTWTSGAFVAGLLGAWLWRLGIASQLLWLVEKITHRDLDGDGAEGEPVDDSHGMEVNAPAARAEVAAHVSRRARAERLEDLLAFVTRCATVGTSERALGIRPGTDARTQYQARRDVLIRLGIGKWKDAARPQAGWSLTVALDEATEILRKHVMDVG